MLVLTQKKFIRNKEERSKIVKNSRIALALIFNIPYRNLDLYVARRIDITLSLTFFEKEM